MTDPMHRMPRVAEAPMSYAVALHHWSATGVATPPLKHPIVGQGRFYHSFRHWLHLVDADAEQFAQVFALIAQWGVGKSRLGYELLAQINDTSRGWWIRDDATGKLVEARLFEEAEREQYLGLYIRYSQVANEFHNVDNWFAFGLYKALVPLATNAIDSSIQGAIAKEAADRLFTKGFEPAKLAVALEIAKKHSDEELYENPTLVTGLCNAAYDYLKQFGVRYVMVVLDELETAAEAATFGMEGNDLKHLDGRAIKLMGKAIKEEDPRRKLPWLRYVALCSPAIGDELREIRSTARRFETDELSSNSFADVSDFVARLRQEGRLETTYPTGLVEAAYAMSGGNFGWFNVIMAAVDERLRDWKGKTVTIGGLFDNLVQVSERIRRYVLDHHAFDHVTVADKALRDCIRDLCYGQLPIAISVLQPADRELVLKARNEFDEPVALLFRRVEWDALQAADALRAAKFTRDQAVYRLGGVDQPIDLRQLFANLSTFAIHTQAGEDVQAKPAEGKLRLLVPLRQAEFIELLHLLYPHPAAEDAGRALWKGLMGGTDLLPADATHIGPSMAMIARLDLRHRRQALSAMAFRDPDANNAHELALKAVTTQRDMEKARQVVVGAMRVIDEQWQYEAVAAGIRDEELVAISTAHRTKTNPQGGLVLCDGLKLHPKGRLIIAWVRNAEELNRLAEGASAQFGTEGRIPVVALTTSRALVDIMANNPAKALAEAKNFILLYQLSASEEHLLHQVGLPATAQAGFQLQQGVFSSAFDQRLHSFRRQFSAAVVEWRVGLDERGMIAWPLRPGARMKESELKLLTAAWSQLLFLEKFPNKPGTLNDLDEKSGLPIGEVPPALRKYEISAAARSRGYRDNERAGIFSRTDESAQAVMPPFLMQVIRRVLVDHHIWTLRDAEKAWFWGYSWEGNKPKDVYLDWMTLACMSGFAQAMKSDPNGESYEVVGRATLSNLIQEAENWLKKTYVSIVTDMADVFGEGMVNQLFGPLGTTDPGTKTKAAKSKIDVCLELAEQLDKEESTARERLLAPEAAETVVRWGRQRNQLTRDISWVYRKESWDQLREENAKTLVFTDDDEPLWRRIRRAQIFMQTVQAIAERIQKRIPTLQQEMQDAAPAGFPAQLFTLSLSKIAHILDGALGGTRTSGSGKSTGTEIAQSSEPGTLRQHLRDLQIAEAMRQLEHLAGEVGCEVAGNSDRPLDQITGTIADGFRQLLKSFNALTGRIADLRTRLTTVQAVIADVADFEMDGKAGHPTALLTKLDRIQEAILTAAEDDAESLRADHDTTAKLGQFGLLMKAAERLFETPNAAAGGLLGEVTTLENLILAYRQRLMQTPDLNKGYQAIEALCRAQRESPPPALTMADLERTTLGKAVALVKATTASLRITGETALAGASVSFDRWLTIVQQVQAGEEPSWDSGEDERLVKKGLLRRTYRLGGG